MVKLVYANNVGVMGETYSIIEQDFLEYIHARIVLMQKSGELQLLQNRLQQDAVNYRDRPKKVEDITRTTENKTWLFDPAIVLDHDVITPGGKLIAKAGTIVNPLNFITLSKTLIFYNANDPEQVRWVADQDKKLKGRDKLILIDGSVLSQEKQFKKTIYFDQAGRLTSRFGITHVPVIVFQQKLNLKIMEVTP